MKTEVNGRLLKEWGFPECPDFKDALEMGQRLEAEGCSMKFIKCSVMLLVPEEKIGMRDTALPFSEAIEIEGPYDAENLASVRKLMGELMRCPVVKSGTLMPDACPAGMQEATIPVGGGIVVDNAIIPAAHSADICCSMYATFFESDDDISDLLDRAKSCTHFGKGGRRKSGKINHEVLDLDVWDNDFLRGLQDMAALQLGTQGDGNHFLYFGRIQITETLIDELITNGYQNLSVMLGMYKDQELRVMVTHHGSRGFGANVFKRGADAAKRLTNRIAKDIPKACQWIPYDTKEGKDYWDALQYVAVWTRVNHQVLHGRILGSKAIASIGNEHNFVWKRGTDFYHGKGATPAWPMNGRTKSLGIIPMNMKDGILLTLGNDNEEYLSFAPHGAGRNMSRTQMLAPYKDDEGEIIESKMLRALAKATEGIEARWYSGTADLSETPMGYKPAAQIINQIKKFNLSQVLGIIYPEGCIMARKFPNHWDKKKK